MKLRRVQQVEFGFSVICLVLSLWALSAGNRAAEDAELKYGANVDSGIHLTLLGFLYLAPLAALFFLSALSLVFSWRISNALFYLATSYFLVPIFLLIVLVFL